MICWEASDQHGKAKRHPWVAFCAFGPNYTAFSASSGVTRGIDLIPVYPQVTCKPVRLAVVSRTEAYQAADANHPKLGSESSPLKKDVFVSRSKPYSGNERRKHFWGRHHPRITLAALYRP